MGVLQAIDPTLFSDGFVKAEQPLWGDAGEEAFLLPSRGFSPGKLPGDDAHGPAAQPLHIGDARKQQMQPFFHLACGGGEGEHLAIAGR